MGGRRWPIGVIGQQAADQMCPACPIGQQPSDQLPLRSIASNPKELGYGE